MALISKKKVIFPIDEQLKDYLKQFNRYTEIPIHYNDLTRYISEFPLYDKNGEDTLWKTLVYTSFETEFVFTSLRNIYAILKADGEINLMNHLYIDRVDLCTYGNTQPFRIRVVNRINDNFDYFYVKKADASRVYGLELEDILSPNRIAYLVHKQTLIEEHIAGIPGDQYIKENLKQKDTHKIRLAKEFVKFNERCFVRLLGDMHSSNFVVQTTPDFEDVHYRIRAIDFDQQSYEGRMAVYMPKYFKQNNPIIFIGVEVLTPESVLQYQMEERFLIANRFKASAYKIKAILKCMKNNKISDSEREKHLASEMAKYYNNSDFYSCNNMGAIVEKSLQILQEYKMKEANF